MSFNQQCHNTEGITNKRIIILTVKKNNIYQKMGEFFTAIPEPACFW